MIRPLKTKSVSKFNTLIDSTPAPKTKSRQTSNNVVGALAEILDTLYSEHQYFNTLLNKLEEEATKLKPGKIPDFHLLLDIVDYLKHYPGQYHHPRENMLFTMLIKRDHSFKKHKDMLEKEHDQLEQLNEKLFTQLTGVVKGDVVNRPTLAKRLNKYIVLYRKHINFESTKIFPAAKGKLNEADIRKLRRKTRYINDPLFGGKLEYKFHRLARNLSYEIGVESSRLAATELGVLESFISKLTKLADTSQQIHTSISSGQKRAFKEQLQTFQDCTEDGFSTKLLSLPLALGKNHTRQVQQGWNNVTQIIKGHQAQSSTH